MKYEKTKVAITKYEAGRPCRDYLAEKAETQLDVRHWGKVCEQDINQVREAFYADTIDINSWDHIKVMSVGIIKEIVGYGV